MNKHGFDGFRRTIEKEFFGHAVVRRNPYTAWFARGEAGEEQVADLLLQFSVFSNHFLAIQVRRMVHAGTEEAERCARDILVSECGVAIDRSTGSPEGRAFSTSNAHINWLRDTAEALGLERRRLGRWEEGWDSTKRFLLGLERSYGSLDRSVGAGASFAIETWAAHGIGEGPEAEAGNFWRQLIIGLERFNERRVAEGKPPLPLAFFRFHFELESGHGASVWRELEASLGEPGFDRAAFLRGGRAALGAIETFWLGLDRARRDAAAEPAWPSAINVAQWAY